MQAERLYNKKQRDRYYSRKARHIVALDQDGEEDAASEGTQGEEGSNQDDQTLNKAKTESLQTFSAIISLSITESFFQVFIQNGILINTVNFKHVVHAYGDPCCVSTDGTKFIFKQPLSKIYNDK